MNSRFVISRDGTRLAYEVAGSGGPTVIVVDGALCHRESGPMRALAAELSAAFTVYVYDRRGRGQSGDTLPYDVAKEIDDIAALIEAGGPAFLFGISSGAVLAVKAAQALGARARGLAVYEPPLVTDPEEQRETVEFTQTVDGFLAKGDRDAAVTTFMVRVMKTLGYPAEAVGGMKGTPIWDGMLALAPTIGYDNHVMAAGQVPPEAKDLGIPALVLFGGASPPNMQSAAGLLASEIPGARLESLPGQSHDVKPSELAPVLRRFWEAIAL